jgi:hypothetical protein
MLEPVCPEAVLPDRALCLPTFSHFLIVNKLLSLSPPPVVGQSDFARVGRISDYDDTANTSKSSTGDEGAGFARVGRTLLVLAVSATMMPLNWR